MQEIVTKDISYAFSTSYIDSEKIKIKYGSALKLPPGTSKNIDLPEKYGNFQKNLHQDTVVEVIESRYTELLHLVNNRILQVQKKTLQRRKKISIIKWYSTYWRWFKNFILS
jgi:cell division protein FtsA